LKTSQEELGVDKKMLSLLKKLQNLAQEIGVLSLKVYQDVSVNNVGKDGTTTLTLTLTKANGLVKKIA